VFSELPVVGDDVGHMQTSAFTSHAQVLSVLEHI